MCWTYPFLLMFEDRSFTLLKTTRNRHVKLNNERTRKARSYWCSTCTCSDLLYRYFNLTVFQLVFCTPPKINMEYPTWWTLVCISGFKYGYPMGIYLRSFSIVRMLSAWPTCCHVRQISQSACERKDLRNTMGRRWSTCFGTKKQMMDLNEGEKPCTPYKLRRIAPEKSLVPVISPVRLGV